MGEYFDWVNVDKREFICPGDFDYGNKFHETVHKDSVPLLALHTLLSGRWSGDHILFLGDECHVPDDSSNYVYRTLTDQYNAYSDGGYTWDMVFETYRNVSGLFRESEGEVRPEIGYFLEDLRNHEKYVHNEYGVDIEHPYDGLFSMIGRRFQYVLNHTRRTCYSLEKTKILYLDRTVSDYADPLPILLGYGRSCNPGIWIGDVIGVSDGIPEGYTLLTEVYLDW